MVMHDMIQTPTTGKGRMKILMPQLLTSGTNKHRLRHLFLLGVLAFGLAAVAGSDDLYKWVDENGNVIYQDTPPPSGVNFEKQTHIDSSTVLRESVGINLDAAARENPVTLYSIEACDTCDLVRQYLEKNAIPFVEKDVQDDVSLQQELQEKTGQLSVPTVIIGDLSIDGYSKFALHQALIDKGYPIGQVESDVTRSRSGGDEKDQPTTSAAQTEQ